MVLAALETIRTARGSVNRLSSGLLLFIILGEWTLVPPDTQLILFPFCSSQMLRMDIPGLL